MNTRGLMELVVINVGYELGVIPASVFSMLVIMALVTTVLTTPLLFSFMKGTELEPYLRDSFGCKAKRPIIKGIRDNAGHFHEGRQLPRKRASRFSCHNCLMHDAGGFIQLH